MPAQALSIPSSARTSQSSPRFSRSTSGRKTQHSYYSIPSLRPARSLLMSQFDRNAQLSFEAAMNVEQLRSTNYMPRKQPPEPASVWHVQPPDFRPQVYRPQPPKRNSRNAIQPWTYQAQYELSTLGDNEIQSSSRASTDLLLPALYEQVQEDSDESQDEAFVTRFKHQHTLDEKVNVIRARQLPLPPYKNPKPHDFRGVSANSDNMPILSSHPSLSMCICV